MKKKIIGFAGTLVVIGMVLLFSWIFIGDKLDEKKIEGVKSCTIGEDVTLSEGIQAFFGYDGTWWIDDDIVYLEAITETHILKASFVWLGDNANIIQFYYDYFELTVPERQKVFDKMVQAAKRKRK